MDVMSMIREGMDVVSVNGDDVGTVKSVKIGNPDAITAEGQTGEENDSLISTVMRAFAGDDNMDDERRERLLRMGYIEVEGAGLSRDFYVAADRIDRTDGQKVYLSVEAPS